eukprot:gene12486-biopygen12545
MLRSVVSRAMLTAASASSALWNTVSSVGNSSFMETMTFCPKRGRSVRRSGLSIHLELLFVPVTIVLHPIKAFNHDTESPEITSNQSSADGKSPTSSAVILYAISAAVFETENPFVSTFSGIGPPKYSTSVVSTPRAVRPAICPL